MKQLCKVVFEKFLTYWEQTLHWQPSSEQEQLFTMLYELVLEGNLTQNLTRITLPEDFWEKHLWDSLRGVLPFWHQTDLKVIDIGTGAGFPGLPLAIAQPTWQLTLLDGTQKKVAFINSVVETESLTNVTVLAGRAEEINRTPKHFQKYDLALVRAVGSAELCAKYAIPFLKSNGTAILYRGQWDQHEQDTLQQYCQALPVNISQVDSFTTPLTASVRHCIYLS
jgi:16S rRNA (guanine527-N7)-methyltransferase